MLIEKWGIVCHPKCCCHVSAFRKNTEKIRELDREIFALGSMGRGHEAFMRASELLVCLKTTGEYDIIGARTLYDIFQCGIMSKRTRKEAVKKIGEAVELSKKINGPDSDTTKRYENLYSNPRSHRNYAVIN